MDSFTEVSEDQKTTITCVFHEGTKFIHKAEIDRLNEQIRDLKYSLKFICNPYSSPEEMKRRVWETADKYGEWINGRGYSGN